MKKLFFAIFFLICISTSYAQLYEGGLFVGGSNYIGDIGSTNYINPNRLAIGGVAKWNWTPRIAVRGTFIYSRIFADDSKSNSTFRQNRGRSFANNLVEGALGIEFSFFKYNLAKTGYTHTPYIIAQLGLANYTIISPTISDSKRFSTLVLPFGLGYKFKLAENIGMAIESSVRYTFNDNLDYNNEFIPELSFGNPNSDDWYVFTGISIVYAFGRPGCYTGVF